MFWGVATPQTHPRSASGNEFFSDASSFFSSLGEVSLLAPQFLFPASKIRDNFGTNNCYVCIQAVP